MYIYKKYMCVGIEIGTDMRGEIPRKCRENAHTNKTKVFLLMQESEKMGYFRQNAMVWQSQPGQTILQWR